MSVLVKSGIHLAALEACWLYILLDILDAATGITLDPRFGLAAFFVPAFAYHLWASRRGRPLLEEIGGFLLFAAVLGLWIVLAPIPAGFIGGRVLAAFQGGILWFLGRRAGRLRPDFAAFLGEFQFGLAILLAVYALIGHFVPGLGTLVPPAVLFFLLGLVGLFLLRDAAGGEQNFSGARRRSRWGLLIGSLILVSASALWLLAVIKPDLLAWALAAAVKVGSFIAWLGARFIEFLAWLLPAPEGGPLKMAPRPAPHPGDPRDTFAFLQLSEQTRKIGQYLVSAGWASLILVALWRVSTDILKWFRRRLGLSAGTETESLEGAFREDLRRIAAMVLAWLKVLCRRLVGGRRGRTLAPGAAGVRQAYRRLIEIGATGGCPRSPARTPAEHLETLGHWLPEARGEMAFITEQYVQARYGPGPVMEGTVGELADRLRQVRRLLRKRRGRGILRRSRT